MAQTLQALIEKEFEQVQKEREDLLGKRAEIDAQLQALDRRLNAAENYRLTLEGKFTVQLPLQPSKKREATGERAPRGSRDALKNQIIDLIKKHPDGLIAKQINDEFPDVKGLANVLALLKKDGTIRQDAKRGPYYIPYKKEGS